MEKIRSDKERATKMRRFLLFSGDDQLCDRGWESLYGAYDLEETALRVADLKLTHRAAWWHLVDTETMEIVADHGEI